MSQIQSQSTCLPSFSRADHRAVSLMPPIWCAETFGWVLRPKARMLIFLCCVINWSLQRSAAGDVHAGFLFDRHSLTLEAGSRTEAVGPFFYQQQAELGNVWAVPPFISRSVLLDGDAEEYDF